MKGWTEIIDTLEVVIDDGNYVGGLSTTEIALILSVLKNNVPFEVFESMRKNIKDRSNGN